MKKMLNKVVGADGEMPAEVPGPEAWVLTAESARPSFGGGAAPIRYR